MEIRRTANAGVLLKLDGAEILLDGVCREVKPYPATPPQIKAELSAKWPDLLAFTHNHKDHYDSVYAADYQKQTNGVVLGPADLSGVRTSAATASANSVTGTPVPSRHIGAAGKCTQHLSFVISGSRCVWFLGDASPLQWRGNDLPKPDVLIVPYAYLTTPSAWEITKSFDAQKVILLHMPKPEEDTIGLWEAVKETVVDDPRVLIPAMGETLFL